MRQLFKIGFLVTILLAATNLILLMLEHPQGAWDAWAFWNHRARMMSRCFQELPLVLATSSHGDYPLCLPGFLARWWVSIGNQDPIVPAVVAFTFALASLGLIMATVSILRDRTQAYLAGLSLLGTWLFLRLSSYQYADVPLGFFVAATLALVLIRERLGDAYQHVLILAGVAGGLAAWTKNEGCLFLAAILCARLVVAALSRKWDNLFRKMAWFALGVAPPLMVLVYFKFALAPPNDLFPGDFLHTIWIKALDPSRCLLIAKAFLSDPVTFHRWGYMAPLLLLYAITAGFSIPDDNKSGVATGFLSIVLVLLGYFAIYVITPYELDWHLSHSLNRLFMHVWPSVIMLYFVSVNGPGRFIRGERIVVPRK